MEFNEVKDALKKEFKYGHPDFVDITLDELDLHSKKNKDYTKGGDPLGNFDRVSNVLSNYPKLDISKPEIVALVYMLKQLDAALWMWNQGYDGEVEGVQDRLRDVHVYIKLMRILVKKNEGDKNVKT